MKYLTRSAIALALLVSHFGFCSVAHSQTKTKSLGGVVTGKVTIRGKPAAGIIVSLRTPDFSPFAGQALKATTDEEGKYRITNVPAGTYEVAPMAPAFVFSEQANAYGSRGKTVFIAEGESVDGLDFALVRGGVITGKITDTEGRPVIEERISLFRADPPGNERGPGNPVAPGNFQTDDRGVYRLFGVPAGRYKVAAGQTGANAGFSYGGRRPYKQTFHPDTTDPSKAMVIEVTEGGEVSNVDITIGLTMPGFTASGRIVDGETGEPVPNVRYGVGKLITERNTGGFVSPPSTSNEHGEFRFDSLVPGKYVASIFPQPDVELSGTPVQFEVIDQDISGLIIKTSKGASITGTLVLDGVEDKVVLARLARVRLYIYVQSDTIDLPTSRQATLNADGSFHVGGLRTGTASAFLSGPDYNEPKDFVVSRIERDGVIQARGLEIKAGEQITGVRVVIAYGSGVIRGTIQYRGALPPGARVFARLSRTGEPNPTNMKTAVVDDRGHFVIEGVAAGTYDLTVNAFIRGLSGKQPSEKQQVNVSDGAVTEVTIILDLNPNPGP